MGFAFLGMDSDRSVDKFLTGIVSCPFDDCPPTFKGRRAKGMLVPILGWLSDRGAKGRPSVGETVGKVSWVIAIEREGSVRAAR